MLEHDIVTRRMYGQDASFVRVRELLSFSFFLSFFSFSNLMCIFTPIV
jgi:hypothetical protein